MANLQRHPESWCNFDALGKPQPYLETFEGATATPGMQALVKAPLGRLGVPILIDIGIDGYLQRADALKLYEIAYYCGGDVLELGTHRGLSTSIIAGALEDRGSGSLETVDIDADANAIARSNVAGRPGSRRVTFTLQDATQRMDALIREQRKFGFIFVDHWHGYEATKEAAERARSLLNPGGFIYFHDYLDPGNADPNHVYGVYQAVEEVICADKGFEFFGNYGCCGLFRLSL